MAVSAKRFAEKTILVDDMSSTSFIRFMMLLYRENTEYTICTNSVQLSIVVGERRTNREELVCNFR